MFNQIDIHGCTTIEAKIRLDNYLNSLSPNTKEITVVHGYSSKYYNNLFGSNININVLVGAS